MSVARLCLCAPAAELAVPSSAKIAFAEWATRSLGWRFAAARARSATVPEVSSATTIARRPASSSIACSRFRPFKATILEAGHSARAFAAALGANGNRNRQLDRLEHMHR